VAERANAGHQVTGANDSRIRSSLTKSNITCSSGVIATSIGTLVSWVVVEGKSSIRNVGVTTTSFSEFAPSKNPNDPATSAITMTIATIAGINRIDLFAS
jgi:hypothetical protein